MTSIKYMTSLLTFYLKGEIRTEKNFIQFKTPNTILGLIPLGAQTEKFTIDQISSTTTNFRLRLKYLIFGIFWLLIAVSCLSDSDTLAAGLICLLLGINNIIDAFEINLIVTTTAGKEQLIDFIIFDKSKAEMAEQEINKMISNRLDDTNNRQQTNRIVSAIQEKWQKAEKLSTGCFSAFSFLFLPSNQAIFVPAGARKQQFP